MTGLKITTKKGTKIDVKRFYLRGISFTAQCPKCKKPIHFKGDDATEYLSYPVIGEIDELSLLCTNCDEWFEILVQLEIELTVGN